MDCKINNGKKRRTNKLEQRRGGRGTGKKARSERDKHEKRDGLNLIICYQNFVASHSACRLVTLPHYCGTRSQN